MKDYKIQDIIFMENNINIIIKNIVDLIKNNISNKPVEGVTTIKKNPSIFTIKLSTIHKNNSILSPDYYSAEKQSEYVYHDLKNCKTITSLVKKIRQLIELKCVVISNNKYFLNSQTITILENWLKFDFQLNFVF